MPKAPLSPKDHIQGGGFGAQEGVWEIGKASAVVHQFPANASTGVQYPPSCMIRLELYKLDPNSLERIEEEPVYEHLGFGPSNGLDRIRPGQLASPDAPEPQDLGNALGTEGNSAYAEEGITIYKNCAWSKFAGALVDKGFKQDVIASTYLPALEGTRFEVERLKGFKSPTDASDRDRTTLGVKRILVYGYEKKPAAAVAKGKTPVAAKGTPVPRTVTGSGAGTAPALQPTNGQEVNPEYETIAIGVLEEMAKQSKGREFKRALFQATFTTYLMKPPHGKMAQADRNTLVNATIKDDAWLLEHAAERGIVFDPQAQTLTFPAE